MESTSLLKILFPILAIFLLAFVGVFFISDREMVINVMNQEVIPVLAEPKEVFNPTILKWELATDEAGFSKRDAHNVVVFLDKLWLLGGVGGTAPDYSKNYSDIWSSSDGENWTLVTDKAPWGKRRAGEVVVFKDKIWLLGGVISGERYSNDVWSSSDGENWVLVKDHAQWMERKGFGSTVFDDKIWIMGGVATTGPVNDVWYSSDGINWVLATEHAGWRERYDLAVETFSEKMWLSGGVFPGDMGEKEVWYSINGIKWQKTEQEILWPGRHGHCFLSSNDYLWIIGGWSGYGHGYNDTWYSKDGIVWNELYKDGVSLWRGREDLECVDFNNKIFMMGGMKSSGARTNDVWVLNKN